MSGTPLFFAEFSDPDNPKQKHQVPVVHIYETGEVEILWKKELITVKKNEIRWARWD